MITQTEEEEYREYYQVFRLITAPVSVRVKAI